MTFTIHRADTTDFVITTGLSTTALGTTTTIYGDDGATILSTINVETHQYITAAGSTWQANLTSSNDTLIGGTTADLIVWDSGATSGISFSGGRARLDTTNPNRLIRVFDLGEANDVLNLTYSNSAGSPGAYSIATTVFGGDGADVLALGLGDDLVLGGGGKDVMFGGGGNDVLWGDNANDDPLDPTSHVDTIFGGSGNDIIHGEGDNDVLDGGTGIDTLFGGGGNDRIDNAVTAYGGDGDDQIDGGGAMRASTLYGDAGADVILGQDDSDTLFGGSGNDTLFGENGGVLLAMGNDTLYGDDGNDTIYGGGGNDTAFGGADDDVLFGDAVTKGLFLPEGSDTLFGGAGNDTIGGQGNDDTLRGDLGIDTIFGGEGFDTIILDTDLTVDAAYAAGPNGYIVGYDGNINNGGYTIALSAGDQMSLDMVDGGTTFGDFGEEIDVDSLLLQMPVGTPGARNILTLSANGAFMPSIVGIEVIVASSAADVINLSWYEGNTGFAYQDNVTVLAGDGADVVFGGNGYDLIMGDDSEGGLFSDTLFGGRGDDTIFGDAGADAAGGNDTLFGGFGSDSLFGGGGNDTIFDIASNDGLVDGGAGGDLIMVRHTEPGERGVINAGFEDGERAGTDGDDRVYVGGVYDYVSATLGAGNDIFISSDIDETSPESGSGNRTDIVFGGTGSDVVSSWYGDDTLYGGDGNDVLWGGTGSDLMQGGAGSDYMYLEDGFDQAYGGADVDFYYVMTFSAGGDFGEGGTPNADIYDMARDDPDGVATQNYLVIAGMFDPTETGPGADFLADGFGMYDLDHDLENFVIGDDENPSDIVQLSNIGGTMWQIVNQGSGYTTVFDQRDISTIALWNNDATGGQPVIEYYNWSDDLHTYVYAG